MYCDTDSPYIISAISQADGNIESLSGYRLRDGMYTVFLNTTDLKTLIPSLASATKSAPTGSVVTSVTTESGSVKSVGYTSFDDIASRASKIYIKHIEGGPTSTDFTDADKTDLKILRLDESQLETLIRQGRIIRNVLYMTT